MAFCPSCGSQVAGAFCAKCGTPVAATSQPAGQQPPAGGYAQQPQGGYQQPQPGGYQQQQQGYQQQPYQQQGYQQPGAAPAQSAGLSDNVASGLCYLFGIISGIIFLVLDPYNKKPNIRFHAFQSIFFGVACIAVYICIMILTMILAAVGVYSMVAIMGILSLVVELGLFVLYVVLLIFAFQGKTFVIPVIGPLAQKQANK